MERDTLIADKAFDADVRVLQPLAAAANTAASCRGPTEPPCMMYD
jgi:hypothetical protein